MKAVHEHLIQLKNSRVALNLLGGYVSRWQIVHPKTGQLEDILYQGKTLKRTGIPILFPQFSEAMGMRKHGFGRDSLWTLTENSFSSATMGLDSTNLALEAKKEFSYHFQAKITINLTEGGALNYTLHVKNTGAVPLPISPGLHPYWAIPHAQKNEIKIAALTLFSAKHINWDNEPPDIVYNYPGKTTIAFPDRTITIEDITENKAIKHIVIWSQKPDQDDSNFVCVEPICGDKNTITTNPILIAPGQDWQMQIQFTATF